MQPLCYPVVIYNLTLFVYFREKQENPNPTGSWPTAGIETGTRDTATQDNVGVCPAFSSGESLLLLSRGIQTAVCSAEQSTPRRNTAKFVQHILPHLPETSPCLCTTVPQEVGKGMEGVGYPVEEPCVFIPGGTESPVVASLLSAEPAVPVSVFLTTGSD